MKVEPIQLRDAWEDPSFDGSFLQTWSYGELLRSLGRDVRRFRVGDAYVQAIVYRAWPRGRSMYVPHAHLSRRELLAFASFCRDEGYLFVRGELLRDASVDSVATELGCRAVAVRNVMPQFVWKTSLSGSTDDLLSSFHKKTRYAIRLAQKKGVEVREQGDAALLGLLLKETGERQSFLPQSSAFVSGFVASPHVRQFTAFFEGIPIASAAFWVESDRWTYVLGASATQYRSLMGASLLHWCAMQEALRAGASEYDWWGTAPFVFKDHPHAASSGDVFWDGSHPLASVARFKVRFGGKGETYQPAFDLVFRSGTYRLFRMRESF